jgi:hypothetical protein
LPSKREKMKNVMFQKDGGLEASLGAWAFIKIKKKA